MDHTNNLSPLQVASAAASLGSSLLVSAWTLVRWVGMSGEEHSSIFEVLLFLAGICVGASVALIATRVQRNAKKSKTIGANVFGKRCLPRPRTTVHRRQIVDWAGAPLATLFWSSVIAVLVVIALDLSRMAGIAIAAMLAASAWAVQVWRSLKREY